MTKCHENWNRKTGNGINTIWKNVCKRIKNLKFMEIFITFLDSKYKRSCNFLKVLSSIYKKNYLERMNESCLSVLLSNFLMQPLLSLRNLSRDQVKIRTI